jgi:thiamine-phosphate pyrophosphorylase
MDPVTGAEALIEGGARILQLRHKGDYTRTVFEEAVRVAELCRAGGVPLIIDDRADIALLLGAGVHVGQDDLPAADARRLLGPGRTIGLSTHDLRQFEAALAEPVDYIAIGPVFPTQSKANPDAVVGLEGVAQALLPAAPRLVSALARPPLVAIGGITRANAASVLAAGADAIAVIRDILPDNCTRRNLRARMEEWQRLVGK